MHPRGQERIPA